MKLFFTPSARHLALDMEVPRGMYISKTFSDGEKYIRVENEVSGPVWVIASTNPPADNLLELFFLLDALRRLTTDVHLIITYFAYARQDKITHRGESLSAQVISDFIKYFGLKKVFVLHIHSRMIKSYLDYQDLFPLDLIFPLVQRSDVVVAPDEGGVPFAKMVGEKCRLPVIHIRKKRITEEKVEIIEISGEVKGKRVMVVDDMIATGGTIIEATEKLLSEGAREVDVYVTHGIFSGNARERLEKSPIQQIYVTNSLPQIEGGKVKVLDISPLILDVIESGVNRY